MFMGRTLLRWAPHLVVMASLVILAGSVVDPRSSPWLTAATCGVWGASMIHGVRRVARGSAWPGTFATFALASGLAALSILPHDAPAFMMPFVATVIVTTLVLPPKPATLLVVLTTLACCANRLSYPGAERASQQRDAFWLAMPATILFAFGQSLRTTMLARRRAERATVRLAASNELLEQQLDVSRELATEQERTRIARELHDSLGHCLTAGHIQLQVASVAVQSGEPAASALQKAQAAMETGLQELRRCVHALRDHPSRMEFGASMQELVDRFPKSHLAVEMSVEGPQRPLGTASEFVLYRTLQEALTNVVKHAHARCVRVRLAYDPHEVRLTVADDGVGASQIAAGNGLTGIRERLALVGGTLYIDTKTGRGFRLKVVLERENLHGYAHRTGR